MLLATALALLITGCAQQTFTVQNKPAAVAPKETITHHFFVSGIGQKKTVDAAKICGGAENVVKTETQQTFRKWIARFITLGIYTPLGMCVLLTIIASGCHRYRQLYLLLINILQVPSDCFCIVISLSLRGEIIPFSGVCQSGGCIIHAGGGGGFTRLTDALTMCNRRRPAATSSRRASFSALASANSFMYFASAQQHHADASACQ